jgi:hypothetical protein
MVAEPEGQAQPQRARLRAHRNRLARINEPGQVERRRRPAAFRPDHEAERHLPLRRVMSPRPAADPGLTERRGLRQRIAGALRARRQSCRQQE